MGGKSAITPTYRGISIREFKHEKRIQIAFSYRGAECRELLPPCTITKSALVYASGLRMEIQRKISDDKFIYADYFPGSVRALQAEGGKQLVRIGYLLEQQVETYRRQVKSGQLSPSTLEGYEKAINSERMQHWHNKTLDDATPSALREWISGMKVTAKFARNLLTPLRSVFEDALNDDLIKFDPFARIALTKLLKQTGKASDYEVEPFTADERAKLLSHCHDSERPMLQFWFATGLRPGELQALRWSKIDWQTKTARIDLNQVARIEKGPKTEAGIRNVDLENLAIQALEAQKQFTLLAGSHIWINPKTGDAWETDAQIRKSLWQPLCKRAGINYRNPYQIRHTFASALLTAGTNPYYVAAQLGHVDVQMVFKTYGKFIPQDYKKPTAQLRAVN